MSKLEYIAGKPITESLPFDPSLYTIRELNQRKTDLLASGIRYNEQLLNTHEKEELKILIDEMMNNSEGYDSVFFIDVGARYLASIFNKLYPVYYPEAKKPKILFARVSRDHAYCVVWANNPTRKYFQDELSNLSDIESLKRAFGEKNTEELAERLKKGMGKNKLIIDDVRDKGRTLDLAKKIFQVVDPLSSHSTYFLSKNSDSLPWYKHRVTDRVKRSAQRETGEFHYKFCLEKSQYSLSNFLKELSQMVKPDGIENEVLQELIVMTYNEILVRKTLSSVALEVTNAKRSARVES
ncbi:hypothetical protein KKG52_03320 [Patescibacteria group bacterium]|nr:hypothetical protein [Patescibacteria group bacterium]